jgi:hypothetical protein
VTNAALAALLYRCAANLITPPGNVSEEETALRRLAAEVAVRPEPLTDASYAALLRKSAAEIVGMADKLDGKAPLRLWAIPLPIRKTASAYALRIGTTDCDFVWAAEAPSTEWTEIPTVRG